MSRGVQKLRKTEVRRAIDAARDAGIPIGRIECRPCGTVVLHAGEPTQAKESDPFDQWMAGRADQA